ncbi:MAG: FAD/NAD(P)-binding protein [Acidobacteria bacterium]|nr:FAD/NAD(P)-binding protein [Acidobacteriota bacterium]
MTDSPYVPRWATIRHIRRETPSVKRLELELDNGQALGHQSGQFVEAGILGLGEAPFSVSSSPRRTDSFDLVIRSVGTVSEKLHGLKTGDRIGIRGPFGHGFELARFRNRDVLVVASEMGLATLRSLVHELLEERLLYGRLMVLVSAPTPEQLLFKDELAEWTNRRDIDFYVTVDRALDREWSGHIGVVTTLFQQLQFDPKQTVTAISGPPVMYKYALLELLGRGVAPASIFLTMERRMRCGVGKCGHCQINNVYVCQRGPVLSYADAGKLEEAFV